MLEGFISLWVMALSLIHLGNPTIENDLHRNKALFNAVLLLYVLWI
jgi:hypothetical protein